MDLKVRQWTRSLQIASRCQRCCHFSNVTSAATTTSAASSAADSVSAFAARLGDAVNAVSRRRSGGGRGGIGQLARRMRDAAASKASSPPTSSGLFGIPELGGGVGGESAVTPSEGFRRLQADAAAAVSGLLGEALDDGGRSRPMVRILDDMSDTVCRVADMADCVRQLHPLPEYRAAAEEACVSIATLVESLNTNRQLYDTLCSAVRDPGPSGDVARFGADAVDTRIGELLIWDFLQSGVHLDSGAGSGFVALCERAFVLGSGFSRGAMKPATLPSPGGGGGGGSGRQRSLFLSAGTTVLRDAAGEHPDGEVRRRAFEAFYAAMPSQESILSELLSTRLEIARIAGFPSFSDRANAGCLLDTAHSVDGFLAGLAGRLQPLVAVDAGAMRRLNGGRDPGAWDFVHLVNRATAACFQDNPSAGRSIEEFFSVGACLRGVAHVAERLFGVRLVLADDTKPGEVWDDRVFKLSVRRGDGEGEELGRIYCDFFPRASKPAQDCHYTIRGGRQGPPRQLPVVCLQLQCPDPAADSHAPSLLPPCQVENLFHEFGHALHSVLGCTRYQHVTGTRCSTDLAEVPSTLMEMFAFQPCVLRQYARHWRTAEPMPERLYAPLRASRRVLPAASRQQQVLYSMLDSRLHSARPPVASTTAAFHELASAPAMQGMPPYPPGTAWHHRFTHLVGYGAKYHAYLVSKAVASLVWSTRFARDPLCSAAGGDLERRLLSRGGEDSTVAMVTELTGRPATAENLAESLVAEVADCQSDLLS